MRRTLWKKGLGGVLAVLWLVFSVWAQPHPPDKTKTAFFAQGHPQEVYESLWWVDARTLLLAVGDSLTQGTRDATNNKYNTENAYLQKVFEKMVEPNGIKFSQPFWDDNERRIHPFRIPTNLGVDGAHIFSVEGKQYGKRVGDPGNNAVKDEYLCERIFPFFLIDNYDKVLYPINLYTGKPVSQLDALIWHLNTHSGPEKVIFWVGNNDASTASLGTGGKNPEFLPIPFDLIKDHLKPLIRYLLEFGQNAGVLAFNPFTLQNIRRNLTTSGDFYAQYNHVMDRIQNEVNSLAKTEVFLLTLPHYPDVGYMIDARDLRYYLRKIRPDYDVPEAFKTQAGRVSLFTFGFLYILLKQGYLPEEINAALTDDGLVQSGRERRKIKNRINGFNRTIDDAAALNGFSLIDIGSYLNRLLRRGVWVDGVRLTRRWGRGNGFSLDGVHGSHTAHALIANQVLAGMGENVYSRAELAGILSSDPYVDWDGDGWVRGRDGDYEPQGLTKLLYLFRDEDEGTPGRAVVDAMMEADPAQVWGLISDVLLGEIIDIPLIKAEAERLGIVPVDSKE